MKNNVGKTNIENEKSGQIFLLRSNSFTVLCKKVSKSCLVYALQWVYTLPAKKRK